MIYIYYLDMADLQDLNCLINERRDLIEKP